HPRDPRRRAPGGALLAAHCRPVRPCPPQTTWELMPNQPGKIDDSEDTVGATVGVRRGIEDGDRGRLHTGQGGAGLGRRAGDRIRGHRAPPGTGWDRVGPGGTGWDRVMSADTRVSLPTAEGAALAHRVSPPEASSTAPQPSPPGALGPLDTHPAWDTR